MPPTTSTSEAPEPPEAPPEIQALVATFLQEFNRATAGGDVDWLYDRLAPAVVEVYGEDACRSHVENVIVGVGELVLLGPALGPMDRVVEVPRPSGGSVTVDLRALYSAEVSYRYQGEARSGTGWVQALDNVGSLGYLAYFAECA